MREDLVATAKERGIDLRQSYCRLGKKALFMKSRYANARQMKRAAKMTKKLKTYLGRVTRDIQRKATNIDSELADLLSMSERLLAQKRNDKKKLYSIHAPEVECIAKGKIHKRYEFGCKVSVATTSRSNWVIGIQALHGNPYDGHTLNGVMAQIKRLTKQELKDVYCDRGYRGNDYEGNAQIHIAGKTKKGAKTTRSIKNWFKRRNAIEPIIGHLKSDCRMDRNYLKGTEGDRINAILAGCGVNLRKLIKAFLYPFFKLRGILEKITRNYPGIHPFGKRTCKTVFPISIYMV